jgi:acetyl esterase/lipase
MAAGFGWSSPFPAEHASFLPWREVRRGPDPAIASITRDVSYPTASGPAETLDVYLPAGPPPPQGWPVIVAIHGGGWRRLDKREYGPRIASQFVNQGYAVVAPDYPLSGRARPTWPINLQDVQAAVGWVKNNASGYAFDSGRVVAMGESAGANLADLLGTTSPTAQPDASGGTSAVAAVVSFSAPSDLAALYRESPSAGRAASQFLGGPPTALPASYTAASPALQVSPADPPFFLVQGGNDPLVPVQQSEEMNAALQAANIRHQMVILPGAGHNLDFPIQTPKNLLSQILAFLDTTWNDDGTQTQTLRT